MNSQQGTVLQLSGWSPYLDSKLEDHPLLTTLTTKHQDVICYTQSLGHIHWNDLSNLKWNVRSPYRSGSLKTAARELTKYKSAIGEYRRSDGVKIV
jgi:hypothetical protein